MPITDGLRELPGGSVVGNPNLAVQGAKRRHRMMDDPLRSITERYPALRPYPWAVIDSRGKPSQYGGQIEFYDPEERDNPIPGRATVEVFNKDLQGNALERAIFGDMLHMLPGRDERFSALRKRFAETLTDEQKAIDRRAYEREQAQYGENRPYEDWFERSRLDAYLRGHLAPDEQDQWRGAYTPQQKDLLDRIQRYLMGQP